jgi:TolA-binding protein
METRAILALFLAFVLRAGAASPTAADLQAQLNKAKAAQTAAETKLRQLKKESDANEAKRKSLTDKVSSLQKQLDDQNWAVVQA